MIISCTESNKLHVKQIEHIEANRVAQVPLRAIWPLRQQKMLYSSFDRAYSGDSTGSVAKQWLMPSASIV